MNDRDRVEGAQGLAGLLNSAQALAEQGNFPGALAAVAEAKKNQSDNIYILAFEKQLEQLTELSTAGSLSEENRLDILESIPGIIERALAGPSAHPSPSPEAEDKSPAVKAERAAALGWLKNQYFQHAHDYVKKGEYEHALAEIRRVFIIDPANATAKDFEEQIQELAALKSGRSTAQARRGAQKEPPAPAPVQPATVSRPAAAPAKPRALKTTAPPVPSEKAKPGTKRRRGVLVAIILVGIAVIGYGIYYFSTRPTAPTGVPPAKSGTVVPQEEVYTGQGATSQDRQFVVPQADSVTAGQPPDTTRGPSVEGEQNQAQPQKPADQRTGPGQPRVSPPREPQGGPRGGGSQPPGVSQETSAPGPGPLEGTSRDGASPASHPTAHQPPLPSAASRPVQKGPQIVRLEAPQLRTPGLRGKVVVKVKVDKAGKPVQATVVKTTNERLNNPVVDAVMQSEFKPAEISSGPVSAWMTIPITVPSN